MNRASLICKLAMKWYVMRMCANSLCPFCPFKKKKCMLIDYILEILRLL